MVTHVSMSTANLYSAARPINENRCRKRQVAKLVRAAVSQEMDDEQRRSANWEKCKSSITTLQEDL